MNTERSVENLRVGPRAADKTEETREQRIVQAHDFLADGFVEAVQSDDPATCVSLVPVHTGDTETAAIVDVLRSMLVDDGAVSDRRMRQVLHLLARPDDTDAVIDLLHELAAAFADDGVDLLLQRGAL